MKIPVKPPEINALIEKTLARKDAKQLSKIFRGSGGPTPGGKYRHWDILRHLKPPDDFTNEEWWISTKLARQQLYQDIPILDKTGNPFRYATVDVALRMLHEIDRDAGGAIRGSDQITNPYTRDTYLLKSLFEEAITSSQLEGAATTTSVAKEMLRVGRSPRDRSEQMIYNNYQAMRFIRQLGKEPLTKNIIIELQRILTQNTLDDATASGRLRAPDEEILVIDQFSGQAIHVPPPAADLTHRLERLCAFANDRDTEPFFHPVVRAIILHFALAYDHPFADGNGRTARALFYWSMRVQGYWLCEFLSISSVLKKAPAQYATSFLYTETDDSDITYFVLYHLRVLLRAIDRLHRYLERKTGEFEETQHLLRSSKRLRAALNYRQLAVINHALKNPGFSYSIESHRGSHNVSYQTARTDLLSLARLGLLLKSKQGRAFIFVVPSNLQQRIRQMP